MRRGTPDEIAALARRQLQDAGLVREFALPADRARHAEPGFDAEEGRPGRLRPDAEVPVALPAHGQRADFPPGRVEGSKSHRAVGRVRDHDRVVDEQRIPERQLGAREGQRNRRAEQPAGDAEPEPGLGAEEAEAMGLLRDALREGPEEGRMGTDAADQCRLGRIGDARRHRQRVIRKLVDHLQHEAERVALQGLRALAQFQHGAIRRPLDPLEQAVAGETVLREVVSPAFMDQRVVGESPDDGEEHRRMTRPFRPAMPEQGPIRIGQRDYLAALRPDRRLQPAGADIVGLGHHSPPPAPIEEIRARVNRRAALFPATGKRLAVPAGFGRSGAKDIRDRPCPSRAAVSPPD